MFFFSILSPFFFLSFFVETHFQSLIDRNSQFIQYEIHSSQVILVSIVAVSKHQTDYIFYFYFKFFDHFLVDFCLKLKFFLRKKRIILCLICLFHPLFFYLLLFIYVLMMKCCVHGATNATEFKRIVFTSKVLV